MTEIEEKALALVSEVLGVQLSLFERSDSHIHEALCRAIEKHEADKAPHAATIEGILKAHEAYKQEVSDAVEDTKFMVETHCDTEALALVSNRLNRFIIAKLDPLVEAMVECGFGDSSNAADDIREALAKRGLKIVETEQ